MPQQLAEIRQWLSRAEPSALKRALALSAELRDRLKVPTSDATPLPPELGSAVWLVYGQTCEALRLRTWREEALRAYAEAIAACRRSNPAIFGPAVRRALALAWMNRGNALLGRSSAGDLDAAIWAYDQAISCFSVVLETQPAPEEADSVRNSLGAAWLNRGRALQEQGTPAGLRGARAAYDQAIAILKAISSAQPWPRVNLAAAQVNLATVVLALLPLTPTEGEGRRLIAVAEDAARAACAGVASHEGDSPAAAEVGLKARRVLACALGERLAVADTKIPASARRAWADEAVEAVESGLVCVRTWEGRGVRGFRPLAERLFRLGVQLYRGYQPQFLAEFVLEAFESGPAGHAAVLFADCPELLTEAREVLVQTRDELRTRHRVDLSGEPTARLLAALSELDVAVQRLARLDGTR